jgi:hypothetical protein
MAVLNSPRFQGSVTIEQCLNGARTMPPGNGALPETDNDAVSRVQRALVDLGYLLSFDEVDGNYGQPYRSGRLALQVRPRDRALRRHCRPEDIKGAR